MCAVWINIHRELAYRRGLVHEPNVFGGALAERLRVGCCSVDTYPEVAGMEQRVVVGQSRQALIVTVKTYGHDLSLYVDMYTRHCT
jgi:hypothetical protein